MNNLLWLLQLGARSHARSQSLTCLTILKSFTPENRCQVENRHRRAYISVGRDACDCNLL